MLGILLSFLTLFPGIHPNLFIPLISLMSGFECIFIYCFYKFSQFIQSFFFYSPNEETSLGMNPFFKLRKKFDVIKACYVSCLISICIGILLMKPFLFIFSHLRVPKLFIILILLFISLYILRRNFPISSLYFLAFGAIGLLCFKVCRDPFFPLLTGSFGLPFLLVYERKKVKRVRTRLNLKKLVKGNLAALFSSFFLIYVPIIGPITSLYFISPFLGPYEFIYALGSLSGYDLILSFYMLKEFGYSRSGFLNEAGKHLYIGLPTICLILLSSLIAFIIGLLISRLKFEVGKKLRAFLLFIICLIAMKEPISLPFLFACAFLAIKLNQKGMKLSIALASLLFPYFANFL